MSSKERIVSDNLHFLGAEKREEVIGAVNKWIDGLRIWPLSPDEHIKVESIDFHLIIAGVRLMASKTVKQKTEAQP